MLPADPLPVASVFGFLGGWKGQDWAGGANKYVKFVLLKENMDTQVS